MTAEETVASVRLAFTLYSASPNDPRDIAHGFMRTCAELLRGTPIKDIPMPEVPREVRLVFEPRPARTARTVAGRREITARLMSPIPDDVDKIQTWWVSTAVLIAQLARSEDDERASYVEAVGHAINSMDDSMLFVDESSADSMVTKMVSKMIVEWRRYQAGRNSMEEWLEISTTAAEDLVDAVQPVRTTSATDARRAAYDLICEDYPNLTNDVETIGWILQQIESCAALAGTQAKDQHQYVARLHQAHVLILGAISCYRAFPRELEVHMERNRIMNRRLAKYASDWLAELDKMESTIMWPSREWFASAKRVSAELRRLGIAMGITNVGLTEETEDPALY